MIFFKTWTLQSASVIQFDIFFSKQMKFYISKVWTKWLGKTSRLFRTVRITLCWRSDYVMRGWLTEMLKDYQRLVYKYYNFEEWIFFYCSPSKHVKNRKTGLETMSFVSIQKTKLVKWLSTSKHGTSLCFALLVFHLGWQLIYFYRPWIFYQVTNFSIQSNSDKRNSEGGKKSFFYP